MKSKLKWSFVVLISLSALMMSFLSACSVSFTTASLSDPSMAKSVDSTTYEAVTKSSVFTTADPVIYCSVKLSNAPSDTEVKSQWIYVQGEADMNNYLINETPINTDGTRYVAFSLEKPTAGWPKGDYVVKLLVDGKEKLQVPFKVQ